MTLESNFSSRAARYFKKHGWLWTRVEAVLPPGFPDTVLGKNFMVGFVELKTESDYRPAQKVFLTNCWKYNVPAVGLEEMKTGVVCGPLIRVKENPQLVEYAENSWRADSLSALSMYKTSLSDYIELVFTGKLRP